MTSGAQALDGQFIEVSWGFHGIPISSRVFFLPRGCSFRLLGVLGVEVDDAWDDSWRGTLQSGFTWKLSLPTWGVDVDGLAYPLYRPMAHRCQARGWSLSARHCPVLSL
jgi:hypothetical protein